MKNINEELHDKELITNNQFEYLEAIRTNKVVSLYLELRLVLYLGILLLTGGLGYLVYQNMGSLSHILSMILIAAGIVGCFYFVDKNALPYSNDEVKASHSYFDYILILGAMLIVALFSYIIIYFELAKFISISTIIGSAILLYLAYRYDSTALLSMGLVAFATAVGLNISPLNWISGELFETANLYTTAILLGILYCLVGYFSDKREIKAHFQFTYQNFGLMLYFIGLLSAIFMSELEIFCAGVLLLSAITIGYFSWIKKEFLFFLYSAISGYIALTYLIYHILDAADGEILMVYYIPFSCIGLVAYIVGNRKHFTNDK